MSRGEIKDAVYKAVAGEIGVSVDLIHDNLRIPGGIAGNFMLAGITCETGIAVKINDLSKLTVGDLVELYCEAQRQANRT